MTEKPRPVPETRPRRSRRGTRNSRHLVVVRTRPTRPVDNAPGTNLCTRFWHPRDRRWSQNFFESLDHAIRLFVDESGWKLVQQQQLEDEFSHELIFHASAEDFEGPSTEEILKGVGLTPRDVKKLLDGDT